MLTVAVVARLPPDSRRFCAMGLIDRLARTMNNDRLVRLARKNEATTDRRAQEEARLAGGAAGRAEGDRILTQMHEKAARCAFFERWFNVVRDGADSGTAWMDDQGLTPKRCLDATAWMDARAE